MPPLVDKGVAPPRSNELHQGVTLEGGGGSESIVQVTSVLYKATRMILVLLPKHPLVFPCSSKFREVSCEQNCPWSSLACTVSLAGHPSRDHAPFRPLLQLQCPMHRRSCLRTDLHPSTAQGTEPDTGDAKKKARRNDKTTTANSYCFQSQAGSLPS